jgi:hypothetical protein
MSRFSERVLIFMVVICIAVLLFLFVPIIVLFQIFLIVLGELCLIWGVIRLDDQIHLHKVKQKHREIMLSRIKQQSPTRY